jgi:hypothetical protein
VPDKHQLIIAQLGHELRDQLDSLAVPRLAICTFVGLRAPDMAWLPDWEGLKKSSKNYKKV